MSTARRGGVRTLCAVVVANLGIWGAAEASTVQPMALDTLADCAGQVIVGTVAEVRPYWADNPRRIESEITFQHVEYLKGRLPDSTESFSLTVPAGRVGDTQMTVCCAPEFHVGDKWVLFLLPTYKTYPVVGIFAGAFLVQADANGVERIAYRRHGQVEAITGIDAKGFVRTNARERLQAHGHLLEAENVRLLPTADGAAAETGMSYDDFVAALRPILAASRSHQLTQPAGQRILVQYRAVPLRPSRLQESLNQDAAKRPGAPPPRGLGQAREEQTAPRTSEHKSGQGTP